MWGLCVGVCVCMCVCVLVCSVCVCGGSVCGVVWLCGVCVCGCVWVGVCGVCVCVLTQHKLGFLNSAPVAIKRQTSRTTCAVVQKRNVNWFTAGLLDALSLIITELC